MSVTLNYGERTGLGKLALSIEKKNRRKEVTSLSKNLLIIRQRMITHTSLYLSSDTFITNMTFIT